MLVMMRSCLQCSRDEKKGFPVISSYIPLFFHTQGTLVFGATGSRNSTWLDELPVGVVRGDQDIGTQQDVRPNNLPRVLMMRGGSHHHKPPLGFVRVILFYPRARVRGVFEHPSVLFQQVLGDGHSRAPASVVAHETTPETDAVSKSRRRCRGPW